MTEIYFLSIRLLYNVGKINMKLIPITMLLMSTSASLMAEEAAVALETMQVTNESADLRAEKIEISRTPGGVALIEIDDLRERNVSSLADMFRFVPGVWATSDSGTDEIFFSSRGSNLDATDFDMNGVKLLQDGLPVTTADGNNHNRIIDPLASGFATIARGANGLKYGASTLGGAVNFVSPTAHNSPAMRLYLNGGTYGQAQGRGTVSKVFNDQFDGLLTVEGKHWEGYRDHNKQDRFGLYSNVGWQISDSISNRLYVSYIENNQQLPGSLTRAEFDADPNQASAKAINGNYQVDVETWRIADKTIWTIDENSSLEFGFSYEEQGQHHPIVDKIIAPFGGPAGTEVFSLLVDTNTEEFGAMARYKHKIDDHDLLVGFNLGLNSVKGGNYRNDGGNRNGLRNEVDNTATTIEAFVMDRWQLNSQWLLTTAVQVVAANREVRETAALASNFAVSPAVLGNTPGSVNNPEDDYFGINPRIGLSYNVNKDINLFGNVSRLYEPPTSFELADNVAGGSEALDAMEGTVIEIGSRGNLDFMSSNNLFWDLSLYYAWIKDEIMSVDDPAAPGTSLSTNIDNTIHAGVEAVVGAKIAIDKNAVHTIDPMLSFTINEFNFDGDKNYGNNELPAAPGYFIKGEAIYHHASGFYAGPTFDFVAERYADFSNSYKIDSHYLLGMRAGWTSDKFRVFAEARNLTDEKYVANHGVRDTAAASADILNPGAPISVYGGIEINF